MMYQHYQLAAVFMKSLNDLFGEDWYCENPNADIDSWVFTDGERRQKAIPRNPYEPMSPSNLMFRQLKSQTDLMDTYISSTAPPKIDNDDLLALVPDFGNEEGEDNDKD